MASKKASKAGKAKTPRKRAPKAAAKVQPEAPFWATGALADWHRRASR